MNKAEFIAELSTKIELPKNKTSEILDAFIETITTAMTAGETVTLVGFGTFQTSARNARKGRNPKNGAEILIPAKTVPKFKAGTALKSSVNGGASA